MGQLAATAPARLQPHHSGGGLLGTFLDIVQTGSSALATLSGGCAAVMFWNPIGDGCGAVALGASGVSAADGWVQAATGNGSVGSAALDTAGLLAGGAGSLAKGAGEAQVADAKSLQAIADSGAVAKGARAAVNGRIAVIRNQGYGDKAVGNVLDGSSTAAAGGGTADSAKKLFGDGP